jgi:hypothetical protein
LHDVGFEPQHRLTPEEQGFAIVTWRYLRVAMVVLVAGLAVSLAYERSKVDCFQTSISGYYFTPVHAYFVGALVAIGVCLFCLKGSTEAEDVLLNVAGLFAPIVAFAPTSDFTSCGVLKGTTMDVDALVANNMRALLAVELIALVLIAVLTRRKGPPRPPPIGFIVTGAVWAATALVFFLAHDFFMKRAHFGAAGLMFACIIAVVWINALGYRDENEAASLRNRYAAIAVAMGGSLAVIPVGLLRDWPYWVIVLEGLLITLFAIFWALQTDDLWVKGLRSGASEQ